MKENRTAGFTLLEMMIAMGISMIVILGVSQFLVTSTTTFRAVDTQVSVQMDVQDALNTISDMVMEGNNIACRNQGTSDECYIVYYNLGQTDSTGKLYNYESADQRIFWLDKTSCNLYLTHISGKTGSDYLDAIQGSHAGKQLLAEGVESFFISYNEKDNNNKYKTLAESGIDAANTTDKNPVMHIEMQFKSEKINRKKKTDGFGYLAQQNVVIRNRLHAIPQITAETPSPAPVVVP